MRRTILGVLAALSVGVCGAVAPASAHHAFAAVFDADNLITIEGVMVEVKLTNPHSWFFLDVTEADGKVVRWGFEAQTPTGLMRNGVSPKTFQIGEKVTVKGCRARDLSNNAAARELIKPDGQVFIVGPRCEPEEPEKKPA
jgi:hypothetical protein